MEDIFNLQRFLEAQNNMYESALAEIQNGKKVGHWIWYIFPQFKNLGRSATSEHYAIKSKEEALAYFHHPVLGTRLKVITEAFLAIENKSAIEVLGSPDHLKMRSCMTLFSIIQNETDLYQKVLDKYYVGAICLNTKRQLEHK